ncbi:MAG: YkgJ family cysteine cluster protein [Halodesulfurarchaeum sp.]
MERLETVLYRARNLDVAELGEAVQAIGFECTRCGACCSRSGNEAHVATVFPREIREIRAETGRAFREVARPIPFGLEGDSGETFEWALQTDDCGDCTFHETDNPSGSRCGIYSSRPLICRTYPFDVDLGFGGDRLEAVAERSGDLIAYECQGLGEPIGRERARSLAETVRERAIRDIEEAIAVRDQYEPVSGDHDIVVHDSEGAKKPDGTPIHGRGPSSNKD